jgi:AcrR family transcriptional regulator
MTTQTISRQQSHAAMGSRIVTAARKLLVNRGEVTLRAVARELGMTAPALYRYAASHEDLVRMTGSPRRPTGRTQTTRRHG